MEQWDLVGGRVGCVPWEEQGRKSQFPCAGWVEITEQAVFSCHVATVEVYFTQEVLGCKWTVPGPPACSPGSQAARQHQVQ